MKVSLLVIGDRGASAVLFCAFTWLVINRTQVALEASLPILLST